MKREDRQRLNPFSGHVADRLFSRFPDFEKFAAIDNDPDADPGSLIIRIPAPGLEADARTLTISTDCEEVTTDFRDASDFVALESDYSSLVPSR